MRQGAGSEQAASSHFGAGSCNAEGRKLPESLVSADAALLCDGDGARCFEEQAYGVVVGGGGSSACLVTAVVLPLLPCEVGVLPLHWRQQQHLFYLGPHSGHFCLSSSYI